MDYSFETGRHRESGDERVGTQDTSRLFVGHAEHMR